MDVTTWPAGQESVSWPFSAALAQTPAPAPPLQVTCTERRFTVPTQGSPKVALLAGTTHDVLPTHAFSTTVDELAAAHAPGANAPHVPAGVP
jgi:hypothetical protein